MKEIAIPDIIGLPPGGYTTTDVIEASMPIASITPCEPVMELAITVFRIEPQVDKYKALLKAHGFTMRGNSIKVAFLADNFPTDTFQNEYGESFLNKITDVASQGAGELAQMMGAKSATEALQAMGETFSGMGKEMGGLGGTIIGGVGKAATGVGAGTEKAIKYLESKEGGIGALGGGAKLISRMLAGHRVDFPQVWKNSGFQPSYTMTVRLYNPNPANPLSTKKYIIGPICALMLLGLPRTEDGSTYSWPFLHKIKATGIYGLDPAFISNVTVIKGGDQQNIAWNQAMGMVDVRIDFGSLFNSMVAGKTYNAKSRPTLGNYLSALEVTEGVPTNMMYKTDLNAYQSGYTTTGGLYTPEKNIAKTLPQVAPDTETPAEARVSAPDKTKEASLVGG